MNDVSSASRGIIVFSGGSAANNLVDVFNQLSEAKRCALSYVIPISDNGGSTSELIRVFGGPGIGDLRSRLVRLIPDNGKDPERIAIKSFFNHRLAVDSIQARNEWQDIVEARHSLWNDISSPKKELIRSFLNLLNLEIVKRARPSSVFNFSSASIGNMFLTGARLFSGSLESAIYLLSSICAIPPSVSVLPAINSNFSYHISAGLANGTVIPGQNAISHPSEATAIPEIPPSHTPSPIPTDPNTPAATPRKPSLDDPDKIEDANLPGSLATLRKPYITFSKTSASSAEALLPARITRIWYINPYGQEIHPPANSKVLAALGPNPPPLAIIYSIGSLYTSIVPALVLRGVGAAIAALPSAHCAKVLILNGSLDRETTSANSSATSNTTTTTHGAPDAFTATDFVAAIASACARSRSPSSALSAAEAAALSPPPPHEWRSYVTHVLHLDGPGTPAVDRAALAAAGIETVRLYGRREAGGAQAGVRYDEAALAQALVALVGRWEGRGERSRRNTFEA